MLFPLGLTVAQVEILRYLAQGRRVGLQTLAHAIGQGPDDVRQHHERFLVRSGLITVVPGGGRELTAAGAAYLEALHADTIA
jgi:Holliday junction resolvasome RuvABC ATP-dependent DNA helicase subunit